VAPRGKFMINRQSSFRVAALLATAVSFGCAEPASDDDTQNMGTYPQAIISGTPATGAAYAAVGALVYYYPEVGVLDVFCSGTLVGAKAITTARHCTPSIDLANESGLIPAIAVVFDDTAPT